jgi:hypothetical protein
MNASGQGKLAERLCGSVDPIENINHAKFDGAHINIVKILIFLSFFAFFFCPDAKEDRLCNPNRCKMHSISGTIYHQ